MKVDAIKPLKRQDSEKINNSEKSTRQLKENDRVQSRFFENNKPCWKFSTVIKKLGKLHYIIELDEGRKIKRHINQLLKSEVIRKKTVRFSDSPQLPVQYQTGEEDEGAILPAVPVAAANPPQVEDCQGPSETANDESISSQPLRRSSRMRRKPSYLDDYVT
ncbi:hypothetical protein GE061_019847 [Apolygus lucorum]|uniref:Uncharacterized protein n=1 Tax=Apolygus lucorum TaxID=248454 RepID=A0A6A4JRL7_APOLU|nr:hypothetical protein GE061_019847 [Apolygus lucorum]